LLLFKRHFLVALIVSLTAAVSKVPGERASERAEMPAAEADLLTEGAATSIGNVLEVAGVLESILGYVGPGHWFFLGAVSTLWRVTYATMEGVQMRTPRYFDARFTKCKLKKTLCSAALASPALLRLAHDGGLSFTSHKFAEAAIKHADFPTLMAAEELGMRLAYDQTSTLSRMAAAQQSLPMLQWLSALPHCKLADDVDLYAAAWGGSVEVLSWLSQQGVNFTEQTMFTVLNAITMLQYSTCTLWAVPGALM
jgi:hypothetical protein